MEARQCPVQATREQVLWFAQSFAAPECARGIVSFLHLTEMPVRRWKVGGNSQTIRFPPGESKTDSSL